MEITVEVIDISNELHVQNHIGTAKYGDKEVRVGSAMPDGSIIVEIGAKSYKVDTKELVTKIGELDEKLEG